jgi:hypothetical protein
MRFNFIQLKIKMLFRKSIVNAASPFPGIMKEESEFPTPTALNIKVCGLHARVCSISFMGR